MSHHPGQVGGAILSVGEMFEIRKVLSSSHMICSLQRVSDRPGRWVGSDFVGLILTPYTPHPPIGEGPLLPVFSLSEGFWGVFFLTG